MDVSADPLCSGALSPEMQHLLSHQHPPSAWVNSRRKRCFDAALAAVGLVLLSPLILATALAVLCSSEGEVLFSQERVGRGHETFTIYKFRTMQDGAEFCGPSVTSKGDKRTTPAGRWLRRFKLDELPQLYTVLRGDMSFVGPRPKLMQHECMHMLCRPGITGAATILFNREEEMLAEVPPDLVEQYTLQVLNPIKARLDMRYAERCSFGTDLRLLASTVFRLGWSAGMMDLAELVEASPGSGPVPLR